MPRNAGTPLLPVNQPVRGGRLHLARPRSVTILVSLLLAAVGCGEETPSPTDPSPTPAFATTGTPLAFFQVSAAAFQTCGVTTDYRAYCWGRNDNGELGDGTTALRLTGPVAVLGGLQFRQVSTNGSHTCAVTTDYRAYCWGHNGHGELGDGTTTGRMTPVPVVGGLPFVQVDAGEQHTCGLTYPDRRAYCWGSGVAGALGNGTTTTRLRPVAVAGGRAFRQVSAGGDHTCGVTTSDAAYCWGWNRYGQIGDGGDVGVRLQPMLVAGERAFRQVDAATAHTCGVTTGGRAFCWGYGRLGQIGDGKTYLRFTPRAVAGGLTFERVSAGNSQTCGETTTNRAYCWGENGIGQLGDGTTTDRLRPVAVAGAT
jgi:alpha-tubulin suppressor-like RCC1 family protein